MIFAKGGPFGGRGTFGLDGSLSQPSEGGGTPPLPEWVPPVDLDADLAELVIEWWNFGDSSRVSVQDGAISRITGRVLRTQLSQDDALKRPTLTGAGIGGRPTAIFNGSQFLQNLAHQLPMGSEPSEILALVRQSDTSSAIKHIFTYGGLTNQTIRALTKRSNGGIMRSGMVIGRGTSFNSPGNSGGGEFTGDHYIQGNFIQDSVLQLDDGNPLITEGNPLATGAGPVTMGADNNGGSRFVGGIAEVVVLRAGATQDQRDRFRAYLSAPIAAPVPGTIEDLQVVASTVDRFTIQFTQASGATSHEYRLDNGPALPLTSGVIGDRPPGSSALIQVRGVNDNGAGEWSEPAVGTTLEEIAFDPTALGALLLRWFDYHNVNRTGATIVNWPDVDNKATLMPINSGGLPTYSDNAFSGGPGITQSASGLLRAASSGDLPTGSEPVEIWAVVQQDNNNSTTRILAGYGPTNQQRSLRCTRVDGVSRATVAAGTGAAVVQATYLGAPFQGRCAVRAIFESTRIGIQLNQGPIVWADATPDTVAGALAVMGGSESASGLWRGTTRHIVFTRRLADQVADDMMWPWATQELEVTIPAPDKIVGMSQGVTTPDTVQLAFAAPPGTVTGYHYRKADGVVQNLPANRTIRVPAASSEQVQVRGYNVGGNGGWSDPLTVTAIDYDEVGPLKDRSIVLLGASLTEETNSISGTFSSGSAALTTNVRGFWYTGNLLAGLPFDIQTVFEVEDSIGTGGMGGRGSNQSAGGKSLYTFQNINYVTTASKARAIVPAIQRNGFPQFSLAQHQAVFLPMLDRYDLQGRDVQFLEGLFCRNSPSWAEGTAPRNVLKQVNEWWQATAAARGKYFLDLREICHNPGSSLDYDVRPDIFREDNVHLNAFGGWHIGKAVRALFQSAGYGWRDFSGEQNYFPNGEMAGSGGTLVNGATGIAPDGFVLDPGSGGLVGVRGEGLVTRDGKQFFELTITPSGTVGGVANIEFGRRGTFGLGMGSGSDVFADFIIEELQFSANAQALFCPQLRFDTNTFTLTGFSMTTADYGLIDFSNEKMALAGTMAQLLTSPSAARAHLTLKVSSEGPAFKVWVRGFRMRSVPDHKVTYPLVIKSADYA